MKQHITISDLQQLSDKGKERINKMGLKPGSKCYSTDTNSIRYITENTQFPIISGGPIYLLPSIGQMIEYLDEHDKKWPDLIFEANHNGWDGEEDLWVTIKEENKDLCDCLWEAVKYILEQP